MARLGDHVDCTEEAEQITHLQARTEMPCDADQDTTQCTLPFVEGNHVVSSSVSLEISTETQSAERSNCVTVDERQLSGVPRSGAANVDDATAVQKSTPSIPPAQIDQNVTLGRSGRTAPAESSESHITSEETRGTTAHNVVSVEMDRNVVGKCVMWHVARIVC